VSPSQDSLYKAIQLEEAGSVLERVRSGDLKLAKDELRLCFKAFAWERNYVALELVLRLGFDLNAAEYTGTPLSDAARGGDKELIDWLFLHGARIDQTSVDRCPLAALASSERPDLVAFFIEKGASPTRLYRCGRSAIDMARIWSKKEILDALGADLNWKRPPWVVCNAPDLTGLRPSPDSLSIVEKEIGFPIPGAHRDFLLEKLPSELFFPGVKDNDDWAWLSEDHRLFHSVRSLIAYNTKDSRKEKKSRRHRGLFVIGTDGNGNDWCIKSSAADKRVWLVDHESGERELAAESIEDFASSLAKGMDPSPNNSLKRTDQSLRD
jgi:hypothetical protein